MIKCTHWKYKNVVENYDKEYTCENPAISFWADFATKYTNAYCERHSEYMFMNLSYSKYQISEDEYLVAKVMFS